MTGRGREYNLVGGDITGWRERITGRGGTHLQEGGGTHNGEGGTHNQVGGTHNGEGGDT